MTRIVDTAHHPTLLLTAPEALVPRSTVEKISRWISVLIVGGTLAGIGALVFSTTEQAHAERRGVIRPVPGLAAKIAAAEAHSRPASPSRQPWMVPPAVERTKPQDRVGVAAAAASVATPHAARTVGQPDLAPAAPVPGLKSVSAEESAQPPACLPEGLRRVLKEVEGRFGRVTLVSTTELHTNNHSRGSVRHQLHSACKAVDFTVAGDAKAVTGFLRSQPEVAGINTYGNNGVIHVDAAEPRRVAQR